MGGCGLDASGLERGPMVGPFEHYSESSCSINAGNFLTRRIGEWMYSSTHSLTSALDGGE
jgi:hypothetical protein